MSSDQARGAGTSGAGASGAGTSGADEDRPGDPACWLRRVCPECGSMADRDPPTVCPQCHAEMPAD
jgi:rubrerythrin